MDLPEESYLVVPYPLPRTRSSLLACLLSPHPSLLILSAPLLSSPLFFYYFPTETKLSLNQSALAPQLLPSRSQVL